MTQTAAETALPEPSRSPLPGDERERTAERLLRSTAARDYDPAVDIDWSAPLADGLPFMPEHRCSLYGTRIWEGLSREQRLELIRHEAASVASVGIWFETILMRMLTKLAYHGDPTSRHVQYAFAEIAEECRHSTMFARLVERIGAPAYGPTPHVHRLGSILPTLTYGPAMWGAILLGEEITDRYQREIVDDEGMQPLMRMVNRIHILEEARHIGFARAELTRTAADLRRWELPYQRMLLGHVGFIVSRSLINPRVYASIGLDPHATRKVALANPHHRETLRFGGEKVIAFLDEAGLIGAPGMRWWRASFLVP
jgi:P-aminobenzoate N-oxygenase AurF